MKDIGIKVKIILKQIVKKYGWSVWTGLVWLRIGSRERQPGHCGHGHKSERVLDQVMNY